MHEEEKFVDIKNFEGKYQISNLGSVKSLLCGKERMMKHRKHCKTGYMVIQLRFLKQKTKTFSVHRLIAEHFIENPENKPCVDHVDGNILNNKISNLRWATRKENMYNQKMASTNTTGYKGVAYHKPTKKFYAHICKDYVISHLGYFNTAKEASDVYEKKAKEMFGDFYRSQ